MTILLETYPLYPKTIRLWKKPIKEEFKTIISYILNNCKYNKIEINKILYTTDGSGAVVELKKSSIAIFFIFMNDRFKKVQ